MVLTGVLGLGILTAAMAARVSASPLLGASVLVVLEVARQRSLADGLDDQVRDAAGIRLVSLTVLLVYLMWTAVGGLSAPQAVVSRVDAVLTTVTGVCLTMALAGRWVERTDLVDRGRPSSHTRMSRLAWVSGLASAVFLGQTLLGVALIGSVGSGAVAMAVGAEIRLTWREAGD